MDRETYKKLILQLWELVRQVETMELIRLEIAARRIGTREEFQAVQAMRRAQADLPKLPR
jgi:hypothetical protein